MQIKCTSLRVKSAQLMVEGLQQKDNYLREMLCSSKKYRKSYNPNEFDGVMGERK